jgi:C4-dicarboxylate-specific signal transduction histidine kinase
MKFKILFIGFFLFILSMIITLNIFFQQNYEAETAEQFAQQQLIVAKTVASSIQETLEHIKEETVSLARLLSKRGLKREGLGEFVQDALAELKDDISLALMITDKDNNLIFSSGNPNRKPFYLHTMKLIYEPATKEAVLKVPITRQDRLIGNVYLFISVDDLTKKFLSRIKTGTRGYAWMMDSEGTLVYHPTEPSMIGRNIFHADKHCLHCHTSFETEKQIVGTTTVGYSIYIAPRGEDKMVAFSRVRLDSINWIVCVSIPYSEVTASIQKSSRLHSIIIISILVLSVTSAVVVIVLNKKRIQAEAKAQYTEKLKEYASELEEIVKQRTKELQKERDILTAIVGSVNAGICLLDNEHRVLWANDVMKELLPETIEGKPIASGLIDSLVDEALVDNHTAQQIMYLDLGHRKGYFHVSVTPLKGATRDNLLFLVQDVTEIKLAEQQLMQTEKLSALARLTAGVAHEIGNPLTSISSYIQILQDHVQDDFSKEALSIISNHINRISLIVRQMSRFAKAKPEEIKPVDIKAIIDSTLELVRYDKRMKQVNVEVSIDEGIPKVLVDENQLVQVFVNLILNALDAMPNGGTIYIKMRSEGRQVKISFTDTGVGIKKEDLQRIFDPFFTTKEKGTGLGLAISYSIIKSFGGEIIVDSIPLKGTTFTVVLPAHERK